MDQVNGNHNHHDHHHHEVSKETQILELKMMRAVLQLAVSQPTGDVEHDEQGVRLLNSITESIELYESNEGMPSDWPLHLRLHLLALTQDDPGFQQDLMTAVNVILDYRDMGAATGHVFDDRLGRRLPE